MDHTDRIEPTRGSTSAAVTSWTWPARPDQLTSIRADVQDWLEAQRVPDDTVGDIVFAVNEAATNAIEHAYLPRHDRATVQVELWYQGLELHLAVTDQGRWRPERNGSGFRGRGMEMMRALFDSLRVATGPTGTRVSLTHLVTDG